MDSDEDRSPAEDIALVSTDALIENFRSNYHLLVASVTYAKSNDVDEFSLVRLGENLDEFISAAEKVSYACFCHSIWQPTTCSTVVSSRETSHTSYRVIYWL